MNPRTELWNLSVLGCLAALAACSGGGGGGGTPPPPPPPPGKLTAVQLHPAAGETGVAVDSSVTVVFDNPLDASTVAARSFYVESLDGRRMAGSVRTDGATAMFEPSTEFDHGASYSAVITTGLHGESGETLASSIRWSFETVDDVIPPLNVTSHAPMNGARDTALDTIVTATFDQEVVAGSVNDSTFTLHSPRGPIASTVRYVASARTAELTPDRPLEPGLAYTASLSSGIKTARGSALTGTTFLFSTADRPTIKSRAPTPDATDVKLIQAVSVEFDRDLDPTSINGISVTVAGNSVAGNASMGGSRRIDFRPARELTPGAEHTVTLTKAIRGANGVSIEAQSWTFQTIARPRILSTNPRDRATGVARDIVIRLTFDRAMDPATINSRTLLVRSGQDDVGGTVNYDPGTTSAEFRPDRALAMLSNYSVEASREIADTDGIELGRGLRFEFDTEGGAWQTTRRLAQLTNTPYANPDVAAASNGEATAVWRQRPSHDYRAHGARFGSDEWRAGERLDPDNDFGDVEAPRVVMADNGNGLAVWQHQSGDSIYIRGNRYEQSRGWTGAFDIARDDDNHHIHHKNAQLAMARDGRAIVVWLFEDWFENRFNIRFRRYQPGSGWTSFDQIFRVDQFDRIESIQIAMDDDGRAVVLFAQSDTNGRKRVHGASSAWNQAWSASLPIDDEDLVARDGRDPVLAIHNGIVIAAWMQDSLHDSVWRDRLWANRYDFDSNTWDGPQLADDVDAADADAPAIAMSESGTALLVWRQKPGTQPPLPKFGYRHFDATRELDGGFGRPQLLNVDLRGYGDAKPEDFRLGMDAAGNALVIYRQESRPGDYDVLSRRYDASSDTWTDAREIETSTLSARAPALDVLPDGQAFVVWYAGDEGFGEVLANRYR